MIGLYENVVRERMIEFDAEMFINIMMTLLNAKRPEDVLKIHADALQVCSEKKKKKKKANQTNNSTTRNT